MDIHVNSCLRTIDIRRMEEDKRKDVIRGLRIANEDFRRVENLCMDFARIFGEIDNVFEHRLTLTHFEIIVNLFEI